MGIVMTFDMMWALILTDELAEMGAIMAKQLKNRYADPKIDEKFLLGLNKPKMTFYDMESSAQKMILPTAKDKVHAPRAKPEPEKDTSDMFFGADKRDRTSLDASDFNFD
jgi:hypothetical protein